MTQPFLIGLTGYAGCGKDAVRAELEKHLGFTGLAFADPLRQMLRELLSYGGVDNVKYMDDRSLKETVIPLLGVSYRHMIQTLGTEWGRGLQSDLWLRLAGGYLDALMDIPNVDEPRFVISDVRFVNEAEWVRARGGVIWRVYRPGLAPVRAHLSEAAMDLIKPDYVIHNVGTLEDLREVVGMSMVLA